MARSSAGGPGAGDAENLLRSLEARLAALEACSRADAERPEITIGYLSELVRCLDEACAINGQSFEAVLRRIEEGAETMYALRPGWPQASPGASETQEDGF